MEKHRALPSGLLCAARELEGAQIRAVVHEGGDAAAIQWFSLEDRNRSFGSGCLLELDADEPLDWQHLQGLQLPEDFASLPACGLYAAAIATSLERSLDDDLCLFRLVFELLANVWQTLRGPFSVVPTPIFATNSKY